MTPITIDSHLRVIRLDAKQWALQILQEGKKDHPQWTSIRWCDSRKSIIRECEERVGFKAAHRSSIEATERFQSSRTMQLLLALPEKARGAA